jgi:HlyD family secretion protein
MKKKPIIPIVILVVAALGYLVWKAWDRGPFLYAGTVEATEVDVPARLGTLIASYDIKEGDTVKAGQKLVTLTGEDYKLEAELAEGDFKRAEPLFRSGSLPKEQYDHLRIKRDDSVLKASWCIVTAPIDGTVLTTYHEPGEWAAPGVKLLTLADLREMWVTMYVPQPVLHKLSYGQKLTGLIPEADNKEIEGVITHINDEAEFTPKNVQTRQERSRLVYGVKVTFQNKDNILKPGMTVEVKIPDSNK